MTTGKLKEITIRVPPEEWRQINRKVFEAETSFQAVGLELFRGWLGESTVKSPQESHEGLERKSYRKYNRYITEEVITLTGKLASIAGVKAVVRLLSAGLELVGNVENNPDDGPSSPFTPIEPLPSEGGGHQNIPDERRERKQAAANY